MTKPKVVIQLEMETFRGSGAGGQKRNKTSSGVRVIHRETGLYAECEEQRSQDQNRKVAIEKLANNPKLLLWAKMQLAAKEQGYRSIENKIDQSLNEDNLKIEFGVESKLGDIKNV